MTSLKDLKTRDEELPLIYINPMTGNRLLLSWFVNDNKKPVPGKYIFVEEDEKGDILKKGTLNGLKAVNEYRNNAIRLGWKFFHLPKIDVKDGDGNVIKAKGKADPVVRPEPKKKLPRKPHNFKQRRRNPAETFEEMKARMQKQITK